MTPQQRESLRTAFDTAVSEMPNAALLTNTFNAKIGNAVFDAHCAALEDRQAEDGQRERLRVISAPMGTGKSSFAIAFVAALVRSHAQDPTLPYGALILVDQIKDAERYYCDLAALIPGQVAVWTKDHDVNASAPRRVVPSEQFHFTDLKHSPIAIVTTACFRSRGAQLSHFSVNGTTNCRALTIVDEQPNDVLTFDVTLENAVDVARAMECAGSPDALRALSTLVQFMAPRDFNSGAASLERPSSREAANLDWFCTVAARNFAQSHTKAAPLVEAVFGFARTLATGYAFIARYVGGTGTRFIGYENTMKLPAGTVLLDATADIDGVHQISPRDLALLPPARFDSLEIVHLPAITTKRLSGFLNTPENRRTYVEAMLETIRVEMEPGQRGLVVCKKRLFDEKLIPHWPEDDSRFADPASYGERYWDIEGRSLCAVHWGTGIGANTWKDADVVFLFDEFYLPRRIAVARAQAILRAPASGGALASMKTLNSKAAAVDFIAEGHLLRHMKQMALRGRGRCFDENGVCGRQKLVLVGADYNRLLLNAEALFPGAAIPALAVTQAQPQQRAQMLVGILGRQDAPSVLSTAEIADELGCSWRSCSKKLLARPDIQAAIRQFGWRYVPGVGRRRAQFVKDDGVVTALAA